MRASCEAFVCRSSERSTLPIDAGEAASSTELQEHGAAKLQMYPSFVTSVLMANAALEVQQDGNLLPALARSDAEDAAAG